MTTRPADQTRYRNLSHDPIQWPAQPFLNPCVRCLEPHVARQRSSAPSPESTTMLPASRFARAELDHAAACRINHGTFVHFDQFRQRRRNIILRNVDDRILRSKKLRRLSCLIALIGRPRVISPIVNEGNGLPNSWVLSAGTVVESSPPLK